MNIKQFLKLSIGVATFLSALPAAAILDNGAQFTPDGKRIVFHSYRDNAGELWIMNRDGSNPKKITEGSNHDRWPLLSKDGNKIAFISRRDGNWDIFTVNTDGSDLKQITKTPVNELGASFSPDGKQLVFSQAGDGPNTAAKLILANADGSDQKTLVNEGLWPQWNAANNKILFGKFSDNNRGIYIYDVKSGKETLLVNKENSPSSAAWSQDGKSVYFVQNGKGGKEIFQINSDGTELRNLGLKAQTDSRPMLSPDGYQLVWGHGRHGDPDLFSYDFHTKKETNLTPNSHYERFPDINLENESLLVSSQRDGNGEIYLVKHGQSPVNLTQSPTDELGGRWSPNGNMFSFSSNAGGAHNVFVMDVHGKHKKQLTHNEKDTFASGWSADGNYLMVTTGSWGQQDTSVISAKSGATIVKLNSDKAELDGAFTPDGKSIVFVRGEGNDFGIVHKVVDSGEETQLVDQIGWNFAPSISPDGKRMAFSSNRDGDLEIFVVDLDGKNLRQLTDNYREDNFPRWSADGNFLIFDSNRYGNFETFTINLDGTNRQKVSVGH